MVTEKTNKEESAATRIYKDLKHKILMVEYEPGSYLTEAHLAELYGVSRMPVRIAIQKLASEGWLESGFRRKLKVKAVTGKSIQDLYDIRAIMETAALKKIFDTKQTWKYSFLIEEALVRMRAAWGHYYDYSVADAQMHMSIIGVLDNDRLNHWYTLICEEMTRVTVMLYKDVSFEESGIPEVMENVAKIVEAMRNNDYDTTYAYYKQDHFAFQHNGKSGTQLIEEYIQRHQIK